MLRPLLLLFLCSAAGLLSANDITVSEVRLANLRDAKKTVHITFDLQWQNSWRTTTAPGNYDAAWVFVKYRENAGPWQHATLTASESVTGAQIDLSQDGRGVFVYRNQPGSGTFSLEDLALTWDYKADKVKQKSVVSLRVYAIEMVYVPAGAYSLGSGGSDEYYPLQRTDGRPYRVTDESAITVGTAAGNLAYGPGQGETGGDGQGPIPAAFPKGTRAFYCMKYEVTQQQYVDFFNTLTPPQKGWMDLSNADGKGTDGRLNRNDFSWTGSGDATTGLPGVPVTYVSPYRAWAYLDWAGLRPMSELEFEKTARGPLTPVPDEFSWGSDRIVATSFTVVDPESPDEAVSNVSTTVPFGNAVYGSSQPENASLRGPLRAGAIAGSGTDQSRTLTGSSYYGVMDLSGNVTELLVSVGHPTGRAYTGLHGDGVLTEEGFDNVEDWPNYLYGYGKRGGSYRTSYYYLLVSDREFANYSTRPGEEDMGFRGVRTAD